MPAIQFDSIRVVIALDMANVSESKIPSEIAPAE